MEIIFALCRETAKSAKFIALEIFALYSIIHVLSSQRNMYCYIKNSALAMPVEVVGSF